MALFIDVARGNPAAAERRAWIEPFWSATRSIAFIARGLLAEHALWQGDTEHALAEARAAIDADALALSGLVPVRHPAGRGRPERAGRPGGARPGPRRRDAARTPNCASRRELLEIAREGARYPSRPEVALGPEGLGWLARCEAEYQRACGATPRRTGRGSSPSSVPATCTRRPGRSGGWRRPSPRPAAGTTRRGAWEPAAATANRLRAAPLRAALDGSGGGPGWIPGPREKTAILRQMRQIPTMRAVARAPPSR